MRIYPAIDIQNGCCVRLRQGKKEEETIYADDPAQMAAHWIQNGAEILHVVDLDAAFDDAKANRTPIEAICRVAQQHGVPVQLGGGIRNQDALKLRFEWGIDRAIIGTAALENFEFVAWAAQTYPGRIVAGLDANEGKVATHGWAAVSEVTAVALGKKLYEAGIRQCVYTDIKRDGMMKGPNMEETRHMMAQTGFDVIASGGVSTLNHIAELAQHGLYGAIVGRALYEKAFTLPEAMRAAHME